MRVKNYFSQVILSIVSAFILLPNISQAAPKSVTCIINYDSSLDNAKEERTLVWDDDNRSNIYVNGRRIPRDLDERSEYALEQFGNSIIINCSRIQSQSATRFVLLKLQKLDFVKQGCQNILTL